MSKRWKVTTHYRTHTVIDEVEELSELHDIIESGPDFTTVNEINIQYAPSLPPAEVKTVDIVFDGPPSHESGRFVEVEDANGRSINFGEWIKRQDEFWVLRIPYPETKSPAVTPTPETDDA